jgi:hypothetical protein
MTLTTIHPTTLRPVWLAALLLIQLIVTPGCSAETETDGARIVRSDTNERESPSLRRDEASDIETDTVREALELSQTTYIVEDTATGASLHLYVRNRSDRTSIIDRVDPSCGCIMATVQRRFARPGDSAHVYIGMMPDQMSLTQPYTVDVYMSSAPSKPLRLTIWRREAYDNRE